MWKSGPQFRYTYALSISASRPIMRPCPIERGVRQHRRVRAARERRGVHQQHRVAGFGRGVGLVRRAGRDERLVLAVVVLDPVRGAAGRRRGPRRAHGLADLLGLVHHDGGREVVEHERHLAARLPPVHRAEEGTDLGRREQALEQPEGVLAEPDDPVARVHAVGEQRVREPVDPLVEGGVGEAHVAVDRRRLRRTGAPVLAQHVAERQAVQR